MPKPENFPDRASYEEAFVYWALDRVPELPAHLIAGAARDVATKDWKEFSA